MQVDDAAERRGAVLERAAADGDDRAATGLPSRRSRTSSRALAKLAPTTSILLTKTRRGTWYLSACRQTVSDWASTPFWASKTTTQPSRTRSERSTSAVKSTWPGVSIRLMVQSRQCERDAGAVDGDAAFLLFLVVVGLGGALVDAAELVLGAGVEEHVFGGGGLAGVDVRNDAEVADLAQVDLGMRRPWQSPRAQRCHRDTEAQRRAKTTEVIRLASSSSLCPLCLCGQSCRLTTRSGRTPCWTRPS